MIGKVVSHYKILEELGRGGMGVVYKAEDIKLKRTVALKFLPPDFTQDHEARGRLMHEAQAAAALNHPNICTIHEIDEEGGRYFIVMEYVEGESLGDRVRRGPLKLEETLKIAGQVAKGLERAHEEGIIHRDIKSENIMITTGGQVKIMDFGLAKSPGATKITGQSSTLGTVRYMSPEQSRGSDVDHRTDIWSLGVVLYETVSGRPPFTGEYDQAVVYSILNQDPEPLTGLRSGVPMRLERLVERCLEKDPAERYQSVLDLASDLGRIGKAFTGARAEGSGRKTGSKSARSRKWWPWIAAACALVLLAVFIVTRERTEPEHPVTKDLSAGRRMLVVLPFENLGKAEDQYFADGVTEEITSRLASLNGLGVISRTSALYYRETNKSIAQIGDELNVDYVLEGTVRWDKRQDGTSFVRVTPQLIRVSDDTHIWAERYDERFDRIFALQTKIAESVVEALDITLSQREHNTISAELTGNIVAYQVFLRGIDYMKYPHSHKAEYLRAQEMLEQAVNLDPGFTIAYIQLCEVHLSMYFFGFDHTEERLSRAKESIDKAIALQPDLPEVHRQLGYYYYQGKLDYDSALKEFSIAAKGLPSDTRLIADIAYIWRRQGHFEQAAANLEQAALIDPKNAAVIYELGYTYILMREYEKGIQCCRNAIALAPENQWGYLVEALGYMYWKGDLESARRVLEKNPVKTSAGSVWSRFWLEFFEGEYQSALEIVETYPEVEIFVQASYAPKDLLAGYTYLHSGDTIRARASFETALDVAEKALRELPGDPRVYSALGHIYAGLGRKSEAKESGRRAVEIYPVSKDAILGAARVFDLVLIYAYSGEYSSALEQMEYLLSFPSGYSMAYFDIFPRMGQLRNQSGYKRLSRLYGQDEK